MFSLQNNQYMLITEGKTQFYVPRNSIDTSPPPRNPAFFNTLAKFKRDTLITILNAYASQFSEKITFADVLSSIGATGMRIANESNYIKKIYFNDANPIAIDFLNRSIERNNFGSFCATSNNEANKFLSNFSGKEDRFDFIDLDPFGSPVPFIDSAMRALKINGIISITATDGAVLCGVYPEVCLRKYGSLSLNTEYFNEIAIRILFSTLSTIACRNNLGVEPIFCHTDKHYIRIYAKVVNSVSSSDGNHGFLQHCIKCGNRNISKHPYTSCNLCDADCKIAGPLWTGKLFDKLLLTESLKLSINTKLTKLLEIALTEVSLPSMYYVTDKISQDLRISSFSVEKIVEKLQNHGFESSKTVFNPKGFRTNGNISDINKLLL